MHMCFNRSFCFVCFEKGYLQRVRRRECSKNRHMNPAVHPPNHWPAETNFEAIKVAEFLKISYFFLFLRIKGDRLFSR